jgi:hypothetical protein
MLKYIFSLSKIKQNNKKYENFDVEDILSNKNSFQRSYHSVKIYKEKKLNEMNQNLKLNKKDFLNSYNLNILTIFLKVLRNC